ncbi:hypothetical protein NDU88_001541 [Pleurodeles waltl]|uniref:Uncharacterized protein n=1 Tax=Pleurodeles waltl TaxID=8319 RepID=A0AAV7ML74_PLEWA|nr:hypothetical protein NDU88_001541 [Pleurodeles waltl]
MGIALLYQDLHNMAVGVGEAELQVSSAEDDVSILKQQVGSVLTASAVLEERAEDAEDYCYCNNLHLVGFPEGSEAHNAAKLMPDWFHLWVPALAGP